MERKIQIYSSELVALSVIESLWERLRELESKTLGELTRASVKEWLRLRQMLKIVQ